ncbi:sigma-70 family RNA polymerase sigma factor [Lederbergia citrisecunda]|uniref:sigma-70 family RNA polymerase sigma factor n=1 Tax=Lederbergia citrisecunda TaxID=2833583 RepID=UPI003D283AC3
MRASHFVLSLSKEGRWRAWTGFDVEKGDFTPFAYRSIRGAMLDELKRESRFEENVIPTTDDVLVYFIGGSEGDDGFDCLHDAIEQLDPSEKEFIQWTFLEGCSLAKCADC